MQPYSHSADPNLAYRNGVDGPPSPGHASADSSERSHKRTGLEPPEGKSDERLTKRARLEVQPSTDSWFLQSQYNHQYIQPYRRPSMPGSHLPDGAFARYMVYPTSPPLLPPSTLASGYDMGGFPPPPPLAVTRTSLLDPYAYAHPPPMAYGAPVAAAAMDPWLYPAASSLTAPRRPSQAQAVAPVMTDHGKAHLNQEHIPLPLLASTSNDDHHAHFSTRVCINISIDQDPNWLSELQVFVRQNILEVCWASREDVAIRNASKKVTLDQVGIRCRFCAHQPPGSRAQRSSAFPSSIPQVYQSVTMMLRDHFDNCSCIPDDTKKRFMTLKSSTCQGATEAKRYWSYAAQRLGMVDSDDGIMMTEGTRSAAKSIPAFGYVPGEVAVPGHREGCPVSLVTEDDQDVTSGFLYTLMSHFYRVELLASERKGNRKGLRLGLPGFGCRHCSDAGRFGMSRVFPARRRVVKSKVSDLYDHICRCNLCPEEDKAALQRLREESKPDPAHEKHFLDLIWERLGHNQANPV